MSERYHPLQNPLAKLVKSSARSSSLWSQALRQRSVWSRAATVGLPIGCLQAVINQGDLWWQHAVTTGVIAKTVVSPLITFSVALISAAGTWVEKQLAGSRR